MVCITLIGKRKYFVSSPQIQTSKFAVKVFGLILKEKITPFDFGDDRYRTWTIRSPICHFDFDKGAGFTPFEIAARTLVFNSMASIYFF